MGPIIGGVIATVASPSVVFLVFAPFLVASALVIALVARESAGKHAHPVLHTGQAASK
jgi:hypothetical protein